MKIDLNKFSYDELLQLNSEIVDRLKFLDRVNAHEIMTQFDLGDEVSFASNNGGRQIGTLIKRNQKTVIVLTKGGKQWKVSPQLISKVKAVNSRSEGNVIDFTNKQ